MHFFNENRSYGAIIYYALRFLNSEAFYFVSIFCSTVIIISSTNKPSKVGSRTLNAASACVTSEQNFQFFINFQHKLRAALTLLGAGLAHFDNSKEHKKYSGVESAVNAFSA